MRTAIEDVQSVPGLSVTRVVSEDATVGSAFTVAVNAVLASAAECPDVPGTDERIELRRLWEQAAKARSGSVPAD